MYPCVLGGFDLESQTLQPRLFVCKIGEGYLERDVVDGGGCCVRPAIAGAQIKGFFDSAGVSVR